MLLIWIIYKGITLSNGFIIVFIGSDAAAYPLRVLGKIYLIDPAYFVHRGLSG
jgi:hypothetical protein